MLSLFLVSIVSAIGPNDQCDTTVKGIYADKVSSFEEQFNRLRNEVAQGRRANHKREVEYAANMHLAKWSTGIAKGAQNCAERCPDNLYSCRNLKGQYGALSQFRTVTSASVAWEPKDYLNKWMEKKETAEQLVVSHVMQFGCGRALRKNSDKYMEYVVCFFDQPPRDGIAPYVVASEKTIGSACKLGRSMTYTALCTTPYLSLIFDNVPKMQHQILQSME